MTIRSCYDCVAPKRYPGCHASCPDYERENAVHQERRAAENREKQIAYGLTEQRTVAVAKAYKKHRAKKGLYNE